MQLSSDARFQSEAGAYWYVEACIWPEGPICPRCGRNERIGRLKGMSTRIGTYKCYHCRKPFTVKINTMLEGSHVLMHVWLKAIFLIGLSCRAITAKDLVKALEVSPRTAEFIMARLQRAMTRRGPPALLQSRPLAANGEPAMDGDERIRPTRANPARETAATRRLRSFVTAAAAFECEPNEAEFQKLFSALVRLEAAAWAPRKKSKVDGTQTDGDGTPASSSPSLDQLRAGARSASEQNLGRRLRKTSSALGKGHAQTMTCRAR